MNITRRDFLYLLGVTGAAAGGFSRVWAVPDGWEKTLASGPRIESWKVSTCGQCPAGCGIRVRLIDGIPVRILGNPIAPANHGFVCPMGEAGLELLYHPDRIRRPLRRSGKKGEPHWEETSWDDALGELSGTLARLVKGKQGGRFGFLMGDGNTLLTQLAGEFTARLGSPHFFPWRAPAVNELGFLQAAGEYPPLAFDLTRTDYLLTFGANLLEAPPSPVYFNRLYGRLKEERPRTGLKMVHVDPRMSQAGINATEWVQIRPGSMGVFALGMAHVILRDRIHDRDFLQRHTTDFQTGDGGFQGLVAREYYPERVSEVTGVPAHTILRVAREFGGARAPLALAGDGTASSETALFTQWAIACLNAVSGGLSAEGLWREPVPVPGSPPALSVFSARSSSFSRRRERDIGSDVPAHWVAEQLPVLSAAGKIPDLEMLMIAQANPMFRAANRTAWRDWLSRIPRVVQFATLLDDTSLHADLVLPLPTYLEQWDLALPAPSLPFAQAGLMQPVVAPVAAGARPLGDVLLELAKESGIALLPEARGRSYREVVEGRLNEIFASGRGTPYFEAVSLEFLEELRQRGWQVYSYPTFADFSRLLEEKGGWWDPEEYPAADWRKRRKLALMTLSALAALREERAFGAPEEKEDDGGGRPNLRIEEGIRKPDGSDSFLLVPFTTLMNMTGYGASQPLLQELSGLHSRLYWHTWAEMHPERAARLALRDGELIRVVSAHGSMTVPVRIVPTVTDEILAVPFGQGHAESGRYAKNIGKNPIALLDPRPDPLSGSASWQSTRVRVEKAGR
jgi:menaquinone reductase, molybdopterin-binding-like subunit